MITKRVFSVLVPLVLVAAGCGDDKKVETPAASTASSASGATVQIVQPAADARIGGNVLDLELKVDGISIVKADADTSGKTGHIHVFVDREPVALGAAIPKEAGIIHTTDTKVRVPGLTIGKHTVKVVLGDGSHTRIGDATAASVTVELLGPSVQVKGPTVHAGGDDLPLDITVEGITIVAADGDTSGKTGHFHVFVDRDPVAPGTAIPKEPGIIHTTDTHVLVKDLFPGEHVFWVVVGDGAHTALNPAVLAKVTVIVS